MPSFPKKCREMPPFPKKCGEMPLFTKKSDKCHFLLKSDKCLLILGGRTTFRGKCTTFTRKCTTFTPNWQKWPILPPTFGKIAEKLRKWWDCAEDFVIFI